MVLAASVKARLRRTMPDARPGDALVLAARPFRSVCTVPARLPEPGTLQTCIPEASAP
jgi:hypothetical protein